MTCTIIGIVVACSGAPIQTTPAQALALMKPRAAEVLDVQQSDRPAGVTRPDTAAEALALMKAHEPKIVAFEVPHDAADVARSRTWSTHSPRRRFGESPWWWRELYDTWWYDPWTVKPWQEQPYPEPCCGQ
ncbi:MAG TPA: hypothetical protein VLV86_24000 [Vicinamibacterales bacterium]|nr:hypothetical protein [Vicinamibacterales bacterium]